jgi:O-antigen/teichoic acid export membrane protein
MNPNLDTEAEIERDARDLHRGVAVNFLGYLIKLSHPLLLVLVVRAYGAERFGLFTFAQAIVLFAARLAVLGLDKGLLWWVPGRSRAESGLRGVLLLASGLAIAVSSLLLLLGSPQILAPFGVDPAVSRPARVMVLAVVVMVWSDLFVHAAMGLRRMEPMVFIKETLVPISLVVLALIGYALNLFELGLPIAFLLSQAIGAGAAYVILARSWGGSPLKDASELRPPRELVRYSIPMWLAELSNSFLQRMDTYAVTLITGDFALVGVYAVVLSFANAVRAIRRSFDPIVLAIVAEVGRARAVERLKAAFSSSTFLVSLTQVPVFVFMLVFSEDLMWLYGEGFGDGARPLVVLCGFWLVVSPANLAGIVVSACGYSRLSLYTVLLAILVQGVFLLVLVPRFGITGAAFAVGFGYLAQGGLAMLQMRRVTGAWNFDRRVLAALVLGVLSVGGMALTAGGLSLPPLNACPALVTRMVSFAVFVAIYGLGTYRFWKAGMMRRPEAL